MSILLIYYPGEEYLDILRYRDIAEAISGEHSMYARSSPLVKMESSKSAARCIQEDATTIKLIWKENETNKKADIDLGTLTLSWMRQEGVLTTAPYYVKWEGDNGYVCYPIPTLVNGAK